MGHTFSSLKTETTKLPIFACGNLPGFLHSKRQKPRHSSFEETSSEFDLLEIKITRKQKYEGKTEQVLCKNIFLTIVDYIYDI